MVENKPIYILDASVLLKWVLIEDEDAQQASVLRNHFQDDRIRVLIPPHCLIEIANILGLKYPQYASLFLSQLIMTKIEECRLSFAVIALGIDLMVNHKGISFYDAAYHALALKEKGIFITADQRYYARTKNEGGILMLKNYPKT